MMIQPMSSPKIVCVALASAFGLLQVVEAQPASRPPEQIFTAKTLFIYNAGGEEGVAAPMMPFSPFHGGPDRAYNQFFAAMKSWGRYELVHAPADADLVFEIKYTDPITTEWINAKVHSAHYEHTHIADATPDTPADIPHPQVALSIRDPKTRAVLWTVTENIDLAALASNRDKNFDRSMSALASDVRKLLGEPAPVKSAPKNLSAAPVPPQIAAAAKVFICNTGTQRVPGGTGEPDQAYNEFYATMKSWGRYALAPAAADADLVFELSFDGAQVHVAIIDPKTRIGLWGFIEDVHWAVVQATAVKNFHRAMANLVTNVARVVGPPGVAIAVPQSVTTAPLPSQLSAAKTVFLSHPDMPAADQPYSQVQAAIKSWGRYELLPSAADADLVLEPSADSAHVNLTILDPKTRDLIWRFTQPVEGALLKSTSQRNFNAAIVALMDNVRNTFSH